MFRLESDRALVQSFRPYDRRVIEMPADITFPLFVRDYLAWTETSGARVYLIFGIPGTHKPLGIIFRRDQSGGDLITQMCDWCHTSGPSSQVGLLTADANTKRRVGVSLCLDLRCKERLEDVANRAGRQPLAVLAALQERMYRFAHEALGLESQSPSPPSRV